jgi:hypothetical protein
MPLFYLLGIGFVIGEVSKIIQRRAANIIIIPAIFKVANAHKHNVLVASRDRAVVCAIMGSKEQGKE